MVGSKMGIGLTHGYGKIINTLSPAQFMDMHTQWCFYVPWRQWTEDCHNLGSTSFADKLPSFFIPQFIHWWNTQMFICWKMTWNLRGRNNFKNPLLVIIIISTFLGISFWWRKCLLFLLQSDATLTIFFSLKVIEYKDEEENWGFQLQLNLPESTYFLMVRFIPVNLKPYLFYRFFEILKHFDFKTLH